MSPSGWKLALPYAGPYEYLAMSASYGCGHTVLFTVIDGYNRKSVTYELQIPRGAIWSNADVSKWNPERAPDTGLFDAGTMIYDSNECGEILVGIDYVDHERHDALGHALVIAAHDDDLDRVRSCLHHLRGIWKRISDASLHAGFCTLPTRPVVSSWYQERSEYMYDAVKAARSNEVISALLDGVSRKVAVAFIADTSVYTVPDAPPGKTTLGTRRMTLGMLQTRGPPGEIEIVYVHAWPSIVSKYEMTMDDFPPNHWRCRYPIRFGLTVDSDHIDAELERRASERDAMARVSERTGRYKRELIEKTWHPSRMRDWCLDAEDAAFFS